MPIPEEQMEQINEASKKVLERYPPMDRPRAGGLIMDKPVDLSKVLERLDQLQKDVTEIKEYLQREELDKLKSEFHQWKTMESK